MKHLPPLMALLLLLPAIAPAADADSTAITISEVLQLGPLALPLPAFHGSKTRGVSLDDLLGSPSLEVATLRPRPGDTALVPPGGRATWTTVSVPADGLVLSSDLAPAEAWFALTLAADRWQKAALRVDAAKDVKLAAWIDGAAVKLDEGKGELELQPGPHQVLLRTAVAGGRSEPWRLAPRVVVEAGAPPSAVVAGLESARRTDIHLVLDAPRLASAQISPDGKLVAVALGAYTSAGKRERWFEVRRFADGSLVTTWRVAGELQDLQWLPSGEQLSYATTTEDKADLWRYDLATGRAERLLQGIEHLGPYQWAPDGSFVVYTVNVEAKPDERKLKRVETPADRQPTWRDRSYLELASIPAGITRRLTAGPLSPQGWEISPDGRRLLFFLADQDLSERPYFSSRLYELDLTTLAVTEVLADRWIDSAQYAPDGSDRLLLQGSPSAFGGLGVMLPQGVQPNDYGGQVYLYDRARGQAVHLSRDLTPDAIRCRWSRADGKIYALCAEGQYERLYRRDPAGSAAWQLVPGGEDCIAQFDLARDARVAVAYGTGANQPNRLHAIDLKGLKERPLLDPGAEAWRDVAFGKAERWEATLPDGARLDGSVFYPVGFDPSRRYPVIVFYYGGTSPVDFGFGSRYPREIWAALGYLVYTPQPSGATGYGQEFAARHVNDWGRRTAREVIDATRAFLAAHPYADPDRVGCIGASYGGFLTEYLLTQTDMFACGISHAGISSISSYWGEGLWGYDYGARALAGEFPWQDRELYVGQSPLFSADKIVTPLLLLHGANDTNVPVGESDQLFTALKLLGRDVEYVQVLGQDHWILDHDQRIVWNDTILAYFARYLKDQPQWWEDLYPSP